MVQTPDRKPGSPGFFVAYGSVGVSDLTKADPFFLPGVRDCPEN